VGRGPGAALVYGKIVGLGSAASGALSRVDTDSEIRNAILNSVTTANSSRKTIRSLGQSLTVEGLTIRNKLSWDSLTSKVISRAVLQEGAKGCLKREDGGIGKSE